MMIKNNIRILILALAAVLLSSCESLFEKASMPECFTPGEAFYNNADEINLGIVGCYNGLQAPLNTEFFLTEVRSDNAKATPSASYESVQMICHLDGFFPQSSNNYIEDYWSDTYANIQNINTVIDQIDVVTDDELKRHFKGELMMLRAYHYFNLVRLFGPLPIYESPTKVSELDDYFIKTRSSVDEVYVLIESDLKYAAANLADEPHNKEAGRVTSWAAKALLGRVYLTEEKYTEAELYLSDVYTKSGHELEADYSNVFTEEESKELLFYVRYAANMGNIGSPFANYFAPIKSVNAVVQGDGKGYNYPTDDLIYTFQERQDPRGDSVSFKTSFLNESGAEIDHLSGGAYCLKYLSQPELVFDAENDFPVLRFADVILMLAEVKNELEGPAAAAPYLNEVRARAGVNPYLDVTTRSAFKDTLLLERRLEFSFENLRWFDMIRFGKAEEIMSAHFGNSATDAEYLDPTEVDGKAQVQNFLPLGTDRLLLLIPEREIKANPNMTQNIYK